MTNYGITALSVTVALAAGAIGTAVRASQSAAEKVPIVAVAGCVAEQGKDEWVLSRATEPAPSIANAPSAGQPYTGPQSGTQTFRLIGTSEFDLPSRKGRIVLVKGLFIKAQPVSRLNVTSVTTIADACTPSATTQGDGGYRLVANWPTLPAGLYFGLKQPPPPPAEREAQAAARRARGEQGGSGQQAQPGISGLAIDRQDRIYAFNRGPKPVMVFDRDGRLVMSGADQEINGKALNPSWQHAGAVDWDGNVYIIERDAHRIVKLSPTLDRFLLQLGTTGEKGNDATHFDLPSGIAVLRNGNIVVTDGYGNNRVVMFSKDGKFLKQVGKGTGGPGDKGSGQGEWVLPHKLALDADDNMYIVDRENRRIQVFDKNLNYLRELKNDGWYPWAIGISRRGTEGIGFIADHAGEYVRKISLKDGAILATWGRQGLGPGEFDWVHAVVVDSHGAVYAADTYGQRLQKFVPGESTTQRR